MNGHQSDFDSLTAVVRDFAHARLWEQFHTPKNLAMAVAGEAGELAAELQWLTPDESQLEALSPEKLRSIAFELADIQIYLLRLADVLGLDIPTLVREKLIINEGRFPMAAPYPTDALG